MKITREVTSERAAFQSKYPWARPGVIFWASEGRFEGFGDTPNEAVRQLRAMKRDPIIRRFFAEEPTCRVFSPESPDLSTGEKR